MENMSESNFESYPPFFRPPIASLEEGFFDLEKPTKQTLDLPVIDLECIDHDRLSEACKDWGVFRLVNHGIPVTLLNQLHDHAKKLFFLSFESKQALFTNPIAYFWGTPALTPSGGVALQKGPQPQHVNWMEGFNVLLRELSHLQYDDPLLDSFGLLLEEYGRHQSRVATRIFEAMAENLNMCLKQSGSYLSPATGLARVYRYPCCPEPNRAWGMDTHTDSSVISILNQDKVGGLQFLKDDKWIDVQPIPNTLVINLGDIMQGLWDPPLQDL
ncbi:gibberellin 2-beta-dioxygenase 6-like isoform X2 [Cornus florida]|uniref:gibberellin 2-beta-dioxygenase 6-like isoform X2 n=1 Tax=Cornus florida TaxID=4283 RepID=UPI00289A30C4|nr:gibberellin 2-beta-dioxygenase 6-like isoform X2 [Cornus florida]